MKKITLILILLPFLSFSQKNISFLGNITFPSRLNDVYGHVDTAGNEYAIVGSITGTFIVDVTDPSNLQQQFFIEGDSSIWRDMKTWDNFAYVTNETAGGLLIIDLNFLPDSIYYERVTDIDSFELRTAHNLFIDEKGYCYLFGSNILNQGAFIIDVSGADKFNPQFIGLYDERYVHDGFARGDTLWTSEILQGDFSVIDISDVNNQQILARRQTSSAVTHNCWLSDDGNYLITTDEIKNGAVDMYDVSNLNNIRLLDSYRSNLGDSTTPHNAYFDGDYFFTAYYKDGLTLVDATKKDNLVEVGNYDTSPLSGPGFEGAWGAYPWLPSGNVLVSDREEGLFVLSPTFTRAAYLEGNVRDENTNFSINNMRVEIMNTKNQKRTIFNGDYKIGVADAGIYDIRFFHPQCQTVIVPGVELISENVFELNISTPCDFTVDIYETANQHNIEIYPNPFENHFNLLIENPENLLSLNVYDINGAKIKEKSKKFNKSESIELNNCSSGIYFMELIFIDKIERISLLKR